MISRRARSPRKHSTQFPRSHLLKSPSKHAPSPLASPSTRIRHPPRALVEMEPETGFEPVTSALRKRRTTVVLLWPIVEEHFGHSYCWPSRLSKNPATRSSSSISQVALPTLGTPRRASSSHAIDAVAHSPAAPPSNSDEHPAQVAPRAASRPDRSPTLPTGVQSPIDRFDAKPTCDLAPKEHAIGRESLTPISRRQKHAGIKPKTEMRRFPRSTRTSPPRGSFQTRMSRTDYVTEK